MLTHIMQEPTESCKQPIRTRYLRHVTGYQPIRYYCFLIRSVPAIMLTLEGAAEHKHITMLFNMSGCGLSNIDYDFIKYLISLLTEYYPDILDNLLVFEMPRLLSDIPPVI
eukprot:sb/3477170/